MKLFNAIAAAAVLGASINSAVPANAGVLIDIKKGIEYQVNDGNPKMAVTDGNRATVFVNSKYEYPASGGFGATKTYTISDARKRSFASDLTKCNAANGGSWGTEFTCNYYVGSHLWLCR